MTKIIYTDFAKEIYQYQKPILESKYQVDLSGFSTQENNLIDRPVKKVNKKLLINPNAIDSLIKNAQYSGIEKAVSKIILEYSTTQELFTEIISQKNKRFAFDQQMENEAITRGFAKALNYNHLTLNSYFTDGSEGVIKKYLYPRFFREGKEKYPSARSFFENLIDFGFNKTYRLYLEKLNEETPKSL